MNALVLQGRIVEGRHMPEPEIRSIKEERNRGIRQSFGYKKYRIVTKQWFQQPAGCAYQQKRWPYDGQAEMLYHVRAEQVAITQLVQWRNKSQEHDEHAQQKRNHLAASDLFLRVVALAQRAYCVEVEAYDEGRSDNYRWLPVPLGEPETESYVCHSWRPLLCFSRLPINITTGNQVF